MLEFPPYRLDKVNRCLWRRKEGADDERILLPPTALAVLLHLVEHAGLLVSEKELLQAVWPRAHVERQAVKKQVFAIRKTLQDNPKTPRYIETLQRRGYRFIAPIHGKPPAAPALPVRHNLPEQLTSFIGRDKEIAEIKELLLTGTRLLILTGAGGCGKTRLALRVAADLGDAYPDGIWLVELAALADPGFVAQAVANVFGLAEQPGKNLRNTIADHLASRRALLVLDNAEHLLAACASLADVVLRQCTRLAIVVTSRERLGVAGELTYRVPSLSFPDPDQVVTPEQVSAYESTRLFIERARLQRSHFAVTEENAPALAAICQRLDGIPLAIELAAPRLRSMSVEEVSQRLDQRFGLLIGGSRTALPRHRTLRSLIDWSYDLLSDAEKALLSRASVFCRGWTLGAAEQVCAGVDVDQGKVLDLLTALTDKSLILVEEHEGATRYGLLETVRQYARDRLKESGHEPECRHRHLAYFLALAETAEPELAGSEQKAWLERLDVEHDNLRAALAWASAPGEDAVGGLRLANALYRFWLTRGDPGAGRGWYAKLLAAAPRGQPAADRGTALRRAGHLAEQQGDYPAAEALLKESLAVQRELGDRCGIAHALRGLGIVARDRGDLPEARTLYEASLASYRDLGDRGGIAQALLGLGVVAFDQRDYPSARTRYEEGLVIFRELGDRTSAASLLMNLGALALELGDYAAARAWNEESLLIGRELGSLWNIAMSLNNLGEVASAEGDHAAARALCREGLVIRRDRGDRLGMVWSLEAIAATYLSTLPVVAARLWGRAQRLREEIGAPLPIPWRARHEGQIDAARAAIGDEAAFDRAWREGQAMALDQALEYALQNS